MRLVLFVLFILQMAACNTSNQQEYFEVQLPEVTIYAKRIPGTPAARENSTFSNENFEQVNYNNVVRP